LAPLLATCWEQALQDKGFIGTWTSTALSVAVAVASVCAAASSYAGDTTLTDGQVVIHNETSFPQNITLEIEGGGEWMRPATSLPHNTVQTEGMKINARLRIDERLGVLCAKCDLIKIYASSTEGMIYYEFVPPAEVKLIPWNKTINLDSLDLDRVDKSFRPMIALEYNGPQPAPPAGPPREIYIANGTPEHTAFLLGYSKNGQNGKANVFFLDSKQGSICRCWDCDEYYFSFPQKAAKLYSLNAGESYIIVTTGEGKPELRRMGD
jgi:hypothetical protein